MSNVEIRVILTTVPSESVGNIIAKALVNAGLVACAQLSQPIRSYYKWEGEVHEATEWTLILKTSTILVDKAEALYRDLHPYDVPQWVVLGATGADRYAEWVNSCNGV